MADAAPKGMLIRRRILHGTVSTYLAQALALGTSFLLTPFILHGVGASAYGLLALFASIGAYGSLLDLGISSALAKYVAEYYTRGEVEHARVLIANSLWLYTFLGLAVLVITPLIALLVPHVFHIPPRQESTARWLVLVVGTGLAVSLPCSVPTVVLHGLQRFDLASTISVVATILSTVAAIIVLELGGGVVALAAVGIPIKLVLQLPLLRLIHRAAPDLRVGWKGAKLRHIRSVASYSASLFAIQVGSRLQSRTDELVIGANMPVRAITPYSFALRLGGLTQIAASQFANVLLPAASALEAEGDYIRLRALFLTSTRLMVALLAPITCAIAVLAGPLLAAWVGPAYARYAPLVVILALSSFVGTHQWPAASMLQGMARHHILALTSLVSGLANVVLSIVLIHPFGLEGVAIGTLIPTAAESLAFVLPYTMRVVQADLIDVVKEIYVPAIVPTGVTVLALYAGRVALSPSSLFSIAIMAGVGCLTYAGVYLSVGASKHERQEVQRLALILFPWAVRGRSRVG